MKGLINFEFGERITVNGDDLTFHSLVPPLKPRADGSEDLQFLGIRSRRAVNFTPDEFLIAYSLGKVRLHRTKDAPGDSCGDDESPTKKILRTWRLFWVREYDKSPVPKSTSKLQAFISAKKARQPDPIDPPSPHTLRRWLRERGQDGDRRPKQMGDRKRTNAGRRSCHPSVKSAYEAASERYWSNYKLTFEDFQNEVRAELILENQRRAEDGQSPIKVPGRTTLWRWLQMERTYDNVALRQGKHIADRQFKGIRNSLSAKRILDVAILDQKRMDVHVCDATRRFVIGRPWLAALIDVKSRMILGYSLSFEDPSVLSAMSCIRAAMRGMPEMKQRFPKIEGQWEAFGVPRTILADNAWENTGSSFVDACADSGISIEWAPVRRPEYKGILERFFSRLDDQLVHKLPGAVVDNPVALRERRIDPQSDAVLTLQELDELVCTYLVEVYSVDRHDGIYDTPLRVWREGVKRDGLELAHDLSALDHAMGKLVRDRMLSHEGVKFQGLSYRSDAVDTLLADLLPLQPANVRRGSAKVKIKYHPEDLSRVFVWNEAKNTYVPLPCTNEKYAYRLSERVHLELQRRKGENDEDFITDDELCVRKSALLRSIQENYDKLPLKERRRKARLTSSLTPSDDSNIKIETVANRVGGDRPEKGSVRSRATKPKAPGPPPVAFEESPPFDPFADRDRAKSIEQSLERIA